MPNPGDDAAQEIMERAWDMASEAMAMEPATLAGARVQVSLLLAIHATGDGLRPPAIELPPLRALLLGCYLPTDRQRYTAGYRNGPHAGPFSSGVPARRCRLAPRVNSAAG